MNILDQCSKLSFLLYDFPFQWVSLESFLLLSSHGFFLIKHKFRNVGFISDCFVLCVRDLDKKLQSALLDFLKARGVNNDLSVFLHEFMTNKDRTELIRWLAKTMSFVLE